MSQAGKLIPSEVASRKAANPRYQLYHPKWHRPRYPIFWWVGKLAYLRFITRELTSLAVGYAAVLLMVEVWMLGRGAEAYQQYRELLGSLPVLVLHGVVLAFLLFHSVTWLNLAPKALVVRLGRKRIPDRLVLVGHYAAWLAATLLVVWLLVGR